MGGSKDLRYPYGWNYYTMRFMGIWPDDRKWNKPTSYVAAITVSMMLCFVCIPQTINLFYIWHDFNLLIENLSMANVTITISMLKTIAFWVHGKPLKTLLKYMADDWETLTKGNDRDSMLRHARFSRITIKISTVMCHAVVYSHAMLKLIASKYIGTRLIFRGYFPYDIDVSPSYELTVIAQVMGALYAATSYTAVDTFVSMLVLHVCGQLATLRKELLRIARPDRNDYHERLARIAKRQEHLNRFAETIESCFNKMLLMQMLGATVQLCFQGFQAFMPISEEAKEIFVFQILFLILYVVYVLLQLYLYCFVGEKLTFESTELANAAYNSEWYNLKPSDARLIIIIMARSRVPLRITAGRFCYFTVQLYTQVLKTSMGYISVLYAMKDK